MRSVERNTKVDLYKTTKSYLYEMGIPVVEIDCEWSIDVQQKIPLGIDRETISQSYLRDLFSEVLNNTYEEKLAKLKEIKHGKELFEELLNNW